MQIRSPDGRLLAFTFSAQIVGLLALFAFDDALVALTLWWERSIGGSLAA